MATADQLLELMFCWIEQMDLCADKLETVTWKLESLRERTQCMFPFIPRLLLDNIVKLFLSSKTLEEAQKIEKKINMITEKIQDLFKQLKMEVRRSNPCRDPDEVDQHVIAEILRAFARRCGLKQQIFTAPTNKNLLSLLKKAGLMDKSGNTDGPKDLSMRLILQFVAILTIFKCRLDGTLLPFLFEEGAKQVISTAFMNVLKTALMVFGGVLLLVLVAEALDKCVQLIKKNNVTEAIQSMTERADHIRKIGGALRGQFDNIKETFEEMAKREREREEKERAIRQLAKRQLAERRQAERQQAERQLAERQREYEERKRQTQKILLCFVILMFSLGLGYLNSMSSNPALMNRGNQETETQTNQEKSEEVGETGQEQEIKTKSDCGINKESNQKLKSNQRPPAKIKMALLNVFSMSKNISRILQLIKQNNLHVFLTTETFLGVDTAERVLTLASPSDYSYCYQVRTNMRGGGVAIQFLDTLQVEHIILDDIIDDIADLEHVAMSLKHEEWVEPLLIINVYRRPGSNIDAFLTKFQWLLDNLLEKYSSVIVSGDFNIWVDTNNTNARKFRALLENYNLVQHVKEPTRYDKNNKANHTLDLVISRNVEISDLFVRDDNISDHHTVYYNARPASKIQKEKPDEDEQVKRFKKSEE